MGDPDPTTTVAATDAIRARLRAVVRRDLKLGPDLVLGDDTPFFESDADLDSLDMLMLVTSVEREFGVKIPSEAVGREVFENIATLADYIAGRDRAGAAGGVALPGSLPAFDPLRALPHADPFLFVSKIVQLIPGSYGEAVWQVAGTEAFFAGHFPGKPLVPGVLIAEALAQLSGLVGAGWEANAAKRGAGKLAHVDVRFERPVAPPAEIVLQSRISRQIGELQQFEVEAGAGGHVVARGTLALHRPDLATPGATS